MARRKRRSILPVLLLFLLCILILAGCVLLALNLMKSAGSVKAEGTYLGETELSDEAAAAACLWLSGAKGYDFDAQKIRERMGELPVVIRLTFEKSDRSGGTFIREVDRESYDAAYERAYVVLAQIMEEMIAQQYAQSAGEDGETISDPAMIRQAVEDTFGMPMEDYLKQCDIGLLPTYEDLALQYDANGSYSVKKGVLTLGNESTPIVGETDTLVLSDLEPSIYRREVQ